MPSPKQQFTYVVMHVICYKFAKLSLVLFVATRIYNVTRAGLNFDCPVSALQKLIWDVANLYNVTELHPFSFCLELTDSAC